LTDELFKTFYRAERDDLWADITDDAAEEIRAVEDDLFMQYVEEAIDQMPIIEIPETFTAEQIQAIERAMDDEWTLPMKQSVTRSMTQCGVDADLIQHLSPAEAKMFCLGYIVRGWARRQAQREDIKETASGGYDISNLPGSDMSRLERIRRRRDGTDREESGVREGGVGDVRGEESLPGDGNIGGGLSVFMD